MTFEIEAQDHNGTILIGKNANFIFNPNTKNGEELSDFLSGCEEISDSTAKLQADKEELLEALEKATDLLEVGYPDISVVKESKSLIQKHKR